MDLPFSQSVAYIAKYVHVSKLNKRCVTLASVNCRPFASEVVIWAILKDFEFASTFTVPLNTRTRVESIICFLNGTSAGAISLPENRNAPLSNQAEESSKDSCFFYTFRGKFHPFWPLKDWRFLNFFRRLAPGVLGGFSIGKVLQGVSKFVPIVNCIFRKAFNASFGKCRLIQVRNLSKWPFKAISN